MCSCAVVPGRLRSYPLARLPAVSSGRGPWGGRYVAHPPLRRTAGRRSTRTQFVSLFAGWISCVAALGGRAPLPPVLHDAPDARARRWLSAQ